MLDKVFIGPRAGRLETGRPPDPVSRVTLRRDGQTAYTAGDDTGRHVEKDVPWASQAMAEKLLARLRAVEYRPFRAEDALADPAAEVGDGVTVGGVYSVLAKADITFDGLYSADIAAPGGDEVEDEYPYKSRARRQSERELARIRSSITKTAERITLLVENEVEGLSGRLELTAKSLTAEIKDTREGLTSKIEQTASSLTTQINNTQSGLNSKIEQTAASIQTQVNGLDNAYSSLRQTVNSISLGVYNGDSSSTITLYRDNVAIASQNISFRGMVTFDDLNGNHGTTIDGGAINTNTLQLNSLYGNYIYLRDARGNIGAEFNIGAASSAADRCEMWARAIMLATNGGHIYLDARNATLEIGDYNVQAGANVIPNRANMFSCGSYGFPWADVYSQDGTIQASDRAGKKEVEYDMDRYSGLFDRLRPCSFLRVNGTSGRRHHGFIAQEVKEALEAEGLTGMDFAGYAEWDGGCGLRYGEIIAMLVHEVQRLKKKGT